MAPKFPNPDPATDSVRDRLNQFIEVAGRAVYPPLAVAPSPTTAGQIWWDISDTVKIRDEANATWASLATTMGAVSFKEAQALTSGEKTQVLTNIGAQPSGGYVRYDQVQALTTAEQSRALSNMGVSYENGAGFYKLPGNRMIQWGSTTASTGANSTISVVFPVAFPAVPSMVIASNGDWGQTSTRALSPVLVHPPTATGATFGWSGLGAGVGVRTNWIAIGGWE